MPRCKVRGILPEHPEWESLQPDTPNEVEAKRLLCTHYKNLVLAWRLGFDKDETGRCSFPNFAACMKSVGFKGNFKSLMGDIDDDGSGQITLVELDPIGAKRLYGFREFLESKYKSLEEAWWHLDFDDSVRLSRTELREACTDIGYSGDTDTLFDYFNKGTTRFITHHDISILGMASDPKFQPPGRVRRPTPKLESPRKNQREKAGTGSRVLDGGALFANYWGDFWMHAGKAAFAVPYFEEGLRLAPGNVTLSKNRKKALADLHSRDVSPTRSPRKLSAARHFIIPQILEEKKRPVSPRPKRQARPMSFGK